MTYLKTFFKFISWHHFYTFLDKEMNKIVNKKICLLYLSILCTSSGPQEFIVRSVLANTSRPICLPTCPNFGSLIPLNNVQILFIRMRLPKFGQGGGSQTQDPISSSCKLDVSLILGHFARVTVAILINIAVAMLTVISGTWSSFDY